MESTKPSTAIPISLPTVEETKEVIEKVNTIVLDLDNLDKTYFNKDRNKQLKAKMEEAIALLDQKPVEISKLAYLIPTQSPTKRRRQSCSTCAARL